MIRTLCRGTALYDDRRRTNLHHVGDSSKIQNELGETVKWQIFGAGGAIIQKKIRKKRKEKERKKGERKGRKKGENSI